MGKQLKFNVGKQLNLKQNLIGDLVGSFTITNSSQNWWVPFKITCTNNKELVFINKREGCLGSSQKQQIKITIQNTNVAPFNGSGKCYIQVQFCFISQKPQSVAQGLSKIDNQNRNTHLFKLSTLTQKIKQTMQRKLQPIKLKNEQYKAKIKCLVAIIVILITFLIVVIVVLKQNQHKYLEMKKQYRYFGLEILWDNYLHKWLDWPQVQTKEVKDWWDF